MLEKSDFPVVIALELLTHLGLEAAVIVPTPTGLGKSIMDATSSVREYLRSKNYHDFDTQGQGQEFKVKHNVLFVLPNSLQESQVSLYRPITKGGDPRIWLGAATRQNVSAFNLLAVTIINGQLYALNMSDYSVRASLQDPKSPFRRILDTFNPASPVITELLKKLHDIAQMGFVKTQRAGDTGVGMTLEFLLGIQANSSQAPDYKGIELKAKRSRGKASENRSTLFSKVPNWKLSPIKSAINLLNTRGYIDPSSGRKQLYHTLRGDYPNSLGLMLEIDEHSDWLKQVHIDLISNKNVHDVTWEMPVLKQDLAAKHKETFWVQAVCCRKEGVEHFHYVKARHTQSPLIGNLPTLIETGVVTVDYTLSLKGNRVRDHGYLFKIHPANIGALFPPSEVYDLT